MSYTTTDVEIAFSNANMLKENIDTSAKQLHALLLHDVVNRLLNYERKYVGDRSGNIPVLPYGSPLNEWSTFGHYLGCSRYDAAYVIRMLNRFEQIDTWMVGNYNLNDLAGVAAFFLYDGATDMLDTWRSAATRRAGYCVPEDLRTYTAAINTFPTAFNSFGDAYRCVNSVSVLQDRVLFRNRKQITWSF